MSGHGPNPLHPGYEIRPLSDRIQRDNRRRLPPWLDPLSLAAGIAIGAVGWAWVVPSLGSFLSDTSLVSFIVSGAIGITGFCIAGNTPRQTRSPFTEFRKPLANIRTRGGAASSKPTPPPSPADWVRTHAKGTEGKGIEVRRYAVANALSDQLSLRETPFVGALTHALLAIGSGRAGLDILDELATIVNHPGMLGRDGTVPEGLDAFQARIVDDGRRRALASFHAYGETRLLGALAQARLVEIVPTADFAWLSFHNGPLWMAACSLGSTGTTPDALGILAHYRAEREAFRALDAPEVSAAVDALLAAEAEGAPQTDEPNGEEGDWVADEGFADQEA